MATERKCAVCDGTGRLVLLRSWFTPDGYASARYGICDGTGQSKYRNPEYERSQRELRKAKAARATEGAV